MSTMNVNERLASLLSEKHLNSPQLPPELATTATALAHTIVIEQQAANAQNVGKPAWFQQQRAAVLSWLIVAMKEAIEFTMRNVPPAATDEPKAKKGKKAEAETE